ncbi:MAG: helix-turn-helix domain-containing protein [Bacteroidetes bacterium]|nr:helix-turn-helix domain-containing protein [Bacteroidota bacterium]
MESYFFEPSPRCSPLVRFYLVLKNRDNLCADKFIPDGNIALVFNFVNEGILIENGESYKLPPHFITVPLVNNYLLKSTSNIDSFIVICKTSILTRLFNLRLTSTAQSPFYSVDLFNGYPIMAKMRNINSSMKRIRIFEEYLNKNFFLDDYEADEIDLVYEKIMTSKGCIKISDLLTDVKMTPRSFRRYFRQRIGISAKELLRIVRVNYVWSLCKNKSYIDYYNIVYECGFFDQSHFIKDFKKIVGETPKEFFTRELSQVVFISGRPQ